MGAAAQMRVGGVARTYLLLLEEAFHGVADHALNGRLDRHQLLPGMVAHGRPESPLTTARLRPPLSSGIRKFLRNPMVAEFPEQTDSPGRDASSASHPVRMEQSNLWQRRHGEDGEEEASEGDLDGEVPTDPRHSPIQGSMEGLPTSHVTEVKVTRRGPGPRPASRPGESALERFSLVPKTTSSDEAWLLGPRKMQDPLQTHSEALLPRPVSRQVTRQHVPTSRHQYPESIPFAQPSHPRGPPGIVIVPVPSARRMKNYPAYVLQTPAPERRRKVLEKGGEHQREVRLPSSFQISFRFNYIPYEYPAKSRDGLAS